MGLLSAFFESIKTEANKPDYLKIICAIAAGHGQGIVETKFERFAEYLRKNGRINRSEPSLIVAEMEIGGKKYVIAVGREVNKGCLTGRCLVEASYALRIDWNSPDVGDILSKTFDEACKNYADSCCVAYNVYCSSTGQYTSDTLAQRGRPSRWDESPVKVPPSLRKFLDANERDEVYIGPKGRAEVYSHEAFMMLMNVTEEIGDADLRLKVIYETADAIIRRHKLNRSAIVQSSNNRIRIGTYELRPSDYQQVEIWAKATRKAPSAFIEMVENEEDGFVVENGSIKKIRFPPNSISCPHSSMICLDVSYVPALTSLHCAENNISEITLSNVPELNSLFCYSNNIDSLDFSKTPNLSILSCMKNNLSYIDLSHTPHISNLSCSDNKIESIDLSCVPQLSVFSCENNMISYLDLSRVPELKMLYCTNNRIANIDLRNTPSLFAMECDNGVNVVKNEGHFILSKENDIFFD